MAFLCLDAHASETLFISILSLILANIYVLLLLSYYNIYLYTIPDLVNRVFCLRKYHAIPDIYVAH